MVTDMSKSQTATAASQPPAAPPWIEIEDSSFRETLASPINAAARSSVEGQPLPMGNPGTSLLNVVNRLTDGSRLMSRSARTGKSVATNTPAQALTSADHSSVDGVRLSGAL